jgi:hypothetical protein
MLAIAGFPESHRFFKGNDTELEQLQVWYHYDKQVYLALYANGKWYRYKKQVSLALYFKGKWEDFSPRNAITPCNVKVNDIVCRYIAWFVHCPCH